VPGSDQWNTRWWMERVTSTMDDMNEHDDAHNDAHDDAHDGPTLPAGDSAPTATAIDDAPPGDERRPVDDLPPVGPPPGSTTAGSPGGGPTSQGAAEGLVRDPYASFGGVLSGLAHRYSWSLVAVRLAFVALVIVSGGTALLLYLAAWVIVPRATVWPPTPVRRRGEGLSNRDLGLGVAAAGLVAFLVVGADGAAAVLVPLVLVGAGIWLLLQHQRTTVDAPTLDPTGAPIPAFATPPPVGSPVPPRRRRVWVLRILVLFLVLATLAVAALAFALVRGAGDGFNLTFGDDELVIANYRPENVDDLPELIDANVGGVRIDLTDIPSAQFEALDEPFELVLDIGDGVVDLTLPDDLAFSLDVSVGGGSIDLDLDGEVDEGRLLGADIAPRSVVFSDPEPDLLVVIDVGDGDVGIGIES